MIQISQAVKIIQQKLQAVQIIYVFGSTGTQFENASSDLDIAVLTPKKLDEVFRFELAEEIARHIKRDVDLIDLHAASTVLRFQVVTTGQRIFCHDKNFCSMFEAMVFSMYVRFNDERREILDSIQQRGQIFHG